MSVTLHAMYFEGTEKKIELIAKGAEFRKKPEIYWHGLVEMAGAKVLSKISNEVCDAYLLSESSLFVWDDRITMITCGRTTLVRAVTYLLDTIPSADLDFLAYERKNEFFPHRQQTDYFADTAALNSRVKGKSYRFGAPDEHHLYLYHLDRPYKPQGVDNTLEILMYNLQGQATEIFSCNQTIERIRELTKLDAIFPGFLIDDYLFEPCGYSLNAIRGNEYYTIHVTPEAVGSYVSFETNVRLGNRISTALRNVVEVFQPRSFDVIYFHPERELKAFEINPFSQRNYVRQTLSCGFEVGFASYYLKNLEPMPAVTLED